MHVRTRRVPSLFVALPFAIALAVVGFASARTTANPSLYVNYTSKCTFTITDDSNKAVTAITPGTYQVQVTTPGSFSGTDLSGISDMTACRGAAQFQLTGPGVNLQTSLNDGDGSQDVLSATFQANSTYLAVDNNQPTVARVSFTTLAAGSGSTTPGGGGGGSTTTTKTTTTPAATLQGTLTATVSASGAVALSYKRKGVIELHAGLYKVTVSDKSKRSGFFLKGTPGATKTLSSVAAVGSHSTTIIVKAGQYYFFATPKGKKIGFVVVSGIYG